MAGGSTTIAETIVQPASAAPKPATPSGTNASARIATRSPNAYEAAIVSASIRHDATNPESDARRSSADAEYSRPPRPMPPSATASTSPNVNTDPPSSGPSM